jgi:hypothetical protein
MLQENRHLGAVHTFHPFAVKSDLERATASISVNAREPGALIGAHLPREADHKALACRNGDWS